MTAFSSGIVFVRSASNDGGFVLSATEDSEAPWLVSAVPALWPR